MKTIFVGVAFAYAILALSATPAFAEPGKPIDGTDVGLDHDPNPPGGRVANGVTDDRGNVTFSNLAPGDYVLVIDGPTLAKAMDRLAPRVPAKHDSGPSVGLGVGGLFGGGSHRSNDGGGPVGGSHNDSHGGSSIGGVALGMNVPLGGDDHRGDAAVPTANIRLTLNTNITSRLVQTFSSETPYCRETAGQGMRIGFTIAQGAAASTVTLVVVGSHTYAE